ncbi:MAG: hypothetical protein AABX50_02335 [Nanoarchaeota archaeon]
MGASSLKRFKDALLGRSLYESRPIIDYKQMALELLKFQERGITGKLTNYRWIPEDKKTIPITPEQAKELLRKKIEGSANKAIRFEMDYHIYHGRFDGALHIIELYEAYESGKGKRVRLPGKIMKLEFLVKPKEQ